MKPPDHSSLGIGIFDSGFGGLTIMQAVCDLLPNENIVYFGDTARVPYGGKSAQTILRYAQENVSFLKDQGIKALVIACHTVCSVAFESLQDTFDIPIIGIIDLAIDEIASMSSKNKLGVLATKATIGSGIYEKKIQEKIPGADVTSISCPLFVPLIEEGYIDHPLTELVIDEYIKPLKERPIDAVLLACTHYPLLYQAIQKKLGSEVLLIDPAKRCALKLKEMLEEKLLLNLKNDSPSYRFYVSDDPEKFSLHGKKFFRRPIENVKQSSVF
ncbi:MAG: glutamate racemase [Chlamydiales bacterium]|nr:glutamate racemase [Chlamydiales bacterium]